MLVKTLAMKSSKLSPSVASTPSEGFDELTSAPAVEYKAPYRNSVTPNIPSSAISRGGVNLNRYYIARSGDTSEDLADLLYSDSNRAGDLVRWNRGQTSWPCR